MKGPGPSNYKRGPFAGPDKSFPIGDAKHARLAIGGATRSERAGNISAKEAGHIKAEARAKLGDAPKRGGASGHHVTYR